jgi:dsRNA-specific ribonuclease
MILANSTLAKYFAENGIPCLFRNHKAKKSAPAREDLLSDIGLILARADSSGINNVRNKLKVILGRADYSPESSGHYALNLLYYMHFTSPVRRFGDLAVNRQLTARLKGLPLPYSHEDLVSISEHLNLSEKKNRRRKYLPEDTGSMVIPEKLYGLGDKGFSTVFGYSLWSGSITPAIEQEFLRRLDSGKLKTRDLYAALFKGELDKMAMITGPVIDHVRREPQEAVSILSMAAQLLQSEPPVYETRRLYPQSNPIYLSTASMFFKDQNYLSEPMESTSKKASQQLAAVSLLENILGIAKREKVDTGLAVKQIDYIYRLNALCSKNRWGKVNYDLIEFEPANDERLFTMNAGINLYGVYFETGPVSAVSRVQAQQEAAMRLLERIQKIPAVDKGNYINALYTLCQRMSLPAPTFEYNGMPPNISGKLRLVLPQTGEKIYDCTGRDWKQAKRAAAEIAFKESIRLLA